MYNCPEFIEVFLAAIRGGFVPTMVNYRYRANELTHLLSDSGAALLITSENLAALWQKVPELDEIIAVNRKSLWDAVRKMRRAGRFDAAVLFPNSLRSALETWLAGVPLRARAPGSLHLRRR